MSTQKPTTPSPWIGQGLLLIALIALTYHHQQLMVRVDALEADIQNVATPTQPTPANLVPPPLVVAPIDPITDPLRLSLYTLKATASINGDLARAQLRALLRWLAPRQNSLPTTYQALLHLQQQHPTVDWAGMHADFQSLHPTTRPKTQRPWHSWQHWVHIGPRATTHGMHMHLKQAIDSHHVNTLQALLNDQMLPKAYTAFANKWLTKLNDTAWDIDPILNTLH